MEPNVVPTNGGTTMSGDFVYYDNTGGQTIQQSDGCPECAEQSLVSDDVRGELVCDACGCVVQNSLIDTGAEWSAFSHSEDRQKSRVGSPLTQMMHDKGLTTKIHWQDTDAHGRKLTPRKKEQVNRLRKWQKRIRVNDANERNLQLALTEINRMSSALGIPESVREVASVLYRRALDENLLQGRSIEGVATSSLYIACRKEEIPRSLDEFEPVSRVERTEIGRTYRSLMAELGLEMRPVEPGHFVPRFCSELDIDQEVQQSALEILEQSAEEGLHSGKSPTSLAGGAIYLAAICCDEHLIQADIAAVANVTEVTIRKRYQEQVSVIETAE